MKYFIELTLLSNLEIPLHFIWKKLYQQIHFALVDIKFGDNISQIGVSLPEYNANDFVVGKKMRLFAEEEQTLKDMQCEKWLDRLQDYVQMRSVEAVPETVNDHACFKHVKMTGNAAKLARRRAKRHNESFERALAHFSGYEEQRTKLPYINMTSQSNGQSFRLFIEKQEKAEPQSGYFSCYGLSDTTTVPLF